MAPRFFLKFNEDNTQMTYTSETGFEEINIGAIGGKSLINGEVYYHVRYIDGIGDGYEGEYKIEPAATLMGEHSEKIEAWEAMHGIAWEAHRAMKSREKLRETSREEISKETGRNESKKRKLKRPAGFAAKRPKTLGRFIIHDRNDGIEDLEETDDNADDVGEEDSDDQDQSTREGAHHRRESSEDNLEEDDADYPEANNIMSSMQQEAEAFFSQINVGELLAAVEERAGPSGEENTTCDSIMAKLLEAYEHSLFALTEAAIKIRGLPCDGWIELAIDKSAKYRGGWLKNTGIDILASMDDRVVKHLVKGDIPKAYHRDRLIRVSLDRLKSMEKKEVNPSIYIQYLVDDQGESPNRRDLERILDKIELYIDTSKPQSQEFAVKVDTVIPQGSKGWTADEVAMDQTKRRYLDGDKDEKRVYRTRIPHVTEFVAAVRLRLENLDDDERLARPLSEVGYATYPLERLGQHAKHSASNYLMNLTDSIAQILYQGKYKIQQFVVHRMWDPLQASIGEVLLSRISQCYTTHGGGFSHHPAGLSCHRIWVIPRRHLTEKAELVCGDEIFLAKLEREIKLLKEHEAVRKEHEAVLEGNAKLEKELEEVEKRRVETLEEQQMLVDQNERALLQHTVEENARLQKILDQLNEMDLTIDQMRRLDEEENGADGDIDEDNGSDNDNEEMGLDDGNVAD